MPPTAAESAFLDQRLLWWPDLPPALEGLRLVQLTDLHVRAHRRRHDRLIDALADCEFDLLLLTGDLMHLPGHENEAIDLLIRLLRRVRPRLGVIGAPGNHDTPEFNRMADRLPMRWLHDQACVVDELPLTILGLHYHKWGPRGDLLSATLDEPDDEARRFRILLAHTPMWMISAADAGIDLMLAGHTHGGQVRPLGRRPLVNRLSWPLHLSTGIFKHRRTTIVISRGLGESWCEGLRFGCPPHAPMIELCRGECPAGQPDQPTPIERW